MDIRCHREYVHFRSVSMQQKSSTHDFRYPTRPDVLVLSEFVQSGAHLLYCWLPAQDNQRIEGCLEFREIGRLRELLGNWMLFLPMECHRYIVSLMSIKALLARQAWPGLTPEPTHKLWEAVKPVGHRSRGA
jgi:hypothetical protein